VTEPPDDRQADRGDPSDAPAEPPRPRPSPGRAPDPDDDIAQLRAEIARQDATRAGLTRRPGLTTVMALVIGAVFGAVGTLTWQVQPTGRAVTGTVAAIDGTGSAIALAEPAELAGTGFGVVGTLWRQVGPDGAPAGEWVRTLSDSGFPTCLRPGDEGREVTLGLVTAPGGADRPASEVVAWLECGPSPNGPDDSGDRG
jgi:hypothetical protein